MNFNSLFAQGKMINSISQELYQARKVVRKVFRPAAREFRYGHEHQPLPKIGPSRERLVGMLLRMEQSRRNGLCSHGSMRNSVEPGTTAAMMPFGAMPRASQESTER